MASYDNRRHFRGIIANLPKALLGVLLLIAIALSFRLFWGHLPTTFQSVSSSGMDIVEISLQVEEPQQPQQPDDSHAITKALVIASTTKDDTTWLSQISPSLNWSLHHYRVDAPLSPQLTVPALKGNEAMVYLTYIIDNYDSLPDVVLFHHGHLNAWHQRLSSLVEVTSLRAEYILQAGYASTRCLSGKENIIVLEGGQPGEWEMFPHLDRQTHLVTLLDAFLDPKEEIPPRIAAPCCAQFAVSREAIRGREREWWMALRGWLLETPLMSINSGRLMEHLWHIWFGMPAEL